MGTPYSDTLKCDKLTKRLLNDVGNLFNISFSQLAGALAHIDLGDLESQVGKTSAKTFDDSQGEGGLVSTVDVSVLHTQDVLEISSILEDKS